jgi:hypothetical protein
VAHEIGRGSEDRRAELQSWYLSGLRPKLASAARAGTVPPGAVVALDSCLRDLLDLSADARPEAA